MLPQRDDTQSADASRRAHVFVVALVAFTCYVGAETPAASWFVGGITHGPTTGDRVALTFDDGPDITWDVSTSDWATNDPLGPQRILSVGAEH